jgi:hypothetical protein
LVHNFYVLYVLFFRALITVEAQVVLQEATSEDVVVLLEVSEVVEVPRVVEDQATLVVHQVEEDITRGLKEATRMVSEVLHSQTRMRSCQMKLR